MHVVIPMDILYSLQCLLHDISDLIVSVALILAGFVSHLLEEVPITVFEDEVDMVFLLCELYYLDKIWMIIQLL